MRSDDERSRRRSRTPPPSSPTRRPLTAATTTIGKYIARFRNEQPLPREARAELNKDEFWWKHRPSSPHSTTSSAAAQAPSLTVKTRARQSHRHALDETMLASPSSVSSSRTSRSRHSSRSSSLPRGSADAHGDGSIPTGSALLSASGEVELLMLSSVSSSSFLPSDIERPSRPSSADISQHVLQDRRELEAIDFSSFRGNDSVMELHLSIEEEEHKDEEDDGGEQTLEDPELVIERVRKRLGFRRSKDLVSLSLGTNEDESMFLGSPSPQPWWQRMMRVDDSFHPASCSDDDIMTNGVIPQNTVTNIKSLESALSGWDSEHNLALTPERSDTARLDSYEDLGHERVESLLSPVTTKGVPMPTSQDETSNRVDPHTNGGADATSSVVLEPTVGGSPAPNQQDFQSQASDVHASEAVESVFSSIDQQLENKPYDVTMEKTSPRLDIDGSDDRAVNNDHQPSPVEEPVEPALHDDDHAPSSIMANSPLCRVENAVATTVLPPLTESPLRASASTSVSSPFSSSSSLSRPGSYSSTTAETAKTLDGLVSLVVQSWSSDLFHPNNDDDEDNGSSKNSSTSDGDGRGASGTRSSSCDKTQVAHDDNALSTQQQSSSMEIYSDPVHVETQMKESNEDHANDTQNMDSQRGALPIANLDQVSMSEPAAITAPSPLSSCGPSDTARLNSAIASIGAGDAERNTCTGKWTPYDQRSEADASKDDEDESDLFEEDEMRYSNSSNQEKKKVNDYE
uniref:Uncharacterized protein n=1 Tax=Globisporangium ultimum (strain ATCC 200006 / CBS 805.95 / DAOM BR144) TaxID=431595 RepID=K3WSZ5_GLOUD